MQQWPESAPLKTTPITLALPTTMEDSRQPLLSSQLNEDHSPDHDHHHQSDHQDHQLPSLSTNTNNVSFTSSFVPDSDDIPPITGFRDFLREYHKESKKLWYLAGPAIFTSLCQYSLGAITQVFSGQVGTLDLAAVSIENSVIAGFSFGIMV